MKILKTLAVVTVVSLMATTAVSAENGYGNNNPSGKHQKGAKHQKFKAALKSVNLTKEQRVTVKEARKNMRTQMKAKRQEMKNSGGMAQFLSVNGVDRNAMVNRATEMARFRANLKADMLSKIFSVLTAEQKTQFIQALCSN